MWPLVRTDQAVTEVAQQLWKLLSICARGLIDLKVYVSAGMVVRADMRAQELVAAIRDIHDPASR
jgi:hypothetical protein